MVWWKISRPLTKSWRPGVKSWRFLCHSPPEDVWGPLSRQGEFGCAWDNARERRSYHEVTHSHPWAVLQHPKRSPNTWGMAFINCPQAYLHDMCWTRFLLDVTVSYFESSECLCHRYTPPNFSCWDVFEGFWGTFCRSFWPFCTAKQKSKCLLVGCQVSRVFRKAWQKSWNGRTRTTKSTNV